MHSQDLAIVTGLVSVAWADGRVADSETQVIDALLEAFQATPSEARQIRRYAQTPRTLDDIPVNDLSHHDRRVLLQHATLLTLIDGEFHEKEQALIDALCDKLHIAHAEAAEIVTAATRRAQELSQLL